MWNLCTRFPRNAAGYETVKQLIRSAGSVGANYRAACRAKSKADFIRRYDRILNLEANAKRCFQAMTPEKNGKYYSVNCTFKSEPESSDNRPIFYYFERTKTGWRFVSLDNSNE